MKSAAKPKLKRIRVRYQGAVQGVGFRPHIFRLAKACRLAGWVSNDAVGVTVEVEGKAADVDKFVRESVRKAPVLARVKSAKVTAGKIRGEKFFVIRESRRGEVVSTQVSADAATCDDCRKELFDPHDRRFRYPFINCTNCGPRFTIIERIPYDRPFTTMKKFPMCPRCRAEYDNPLDRRFHAQPNACPECGPKLSLLSRTGKKIKGDPLTKAAKLLAAGKIIAVKSLGGYQLACDARNETAVAKLRSRKFREDKPFALMAANLAAIAKCARVSRAERELLSSPERPIVLLRKKPGGRIAESVAPRQKNLGFMIPYTPLHHLLMAQCRFPLVMTSGNLSDEPIAFRDQDAISRLQAIADFFLTHDRPVFIRCDDSVVRIFEDKLYPLRRARGYAPRPLEIVFPEKRALLAAGAELKSTFALAKAGQVILSHHIGDLENVETLAAFEEAVGHYRRVFEIDPEMVVHDLHPDYLSTQYARKLKLPALAVQHHYAHAAAVMAEHELNRKVIAICFDGTGYGADGKIWGGEFLIADWEGFERKAHLEYVAMPGGEKAIRENWRMALAWMDRLYGPDLWKLKIDFIKHMDREKAELMLLAAQKGINAPFTSSMGRLFDAMSALLNLRDSANYEGQPAIELEMVAEQKERLWYQFNYCREGAKLIIKPAPMIRSAIKDLTRGVGLAKISARFHNSVTRMAAEACMEIRRETGIREVVLSGGVFQNFWLLTRVRQLLAKGGFRVYVHRLTPCNDGGISLGQAAIGLRRMQDVLGSAHAG